MSITFTKSIPLFHPSSFETTSADTPNGSLSIKELEIERTKRLATDDLNNLKSPGNFNIEDKKLIDTKTRFDAKIQTEESLLTFLYFSKKNVQNIQDIIKYKIYQDTKMVIDNQPETEILVIMRSIYFEYSSHPPILSENIDSETKLKIIAMYTAETKRLNQLVVDYIYPNVLSGLQQYLDYLRDASSVPYQKNQPSSSDNVTGQREYRSITQTLLGTTL